MQLLEAVKATPGAVANAPQAAVQNHPNASLAGGTSAVSILIIWACHEIHINLTNEEAGALTGVMTTFLLFLGNAGVIGAWNRLKYGRSGPPHQQAPVVTHVVEKKAPKKKPKT